MTERWLYGVDGGLQGSLPPWEADLWDDGIAPPSRGYGSLTELVLINGEVVDSRSRPVAGSGYECAALELEHYPGMAERQIGAILAEAARRWDLTAAKAIHRYGKLRPGEEIVLVLCASRHRHAAFEAASFVMDYMKTKAPFWKREHLVDGTVGGWVEAKDSDDTAVGRWA